MSKVAPKWHPYSGIGVPKLLKGVVPTAGAPTTRQSLVAQAGVVTKAVAPPARAPTARQPQERGSKGGNGDRDKASEVDDAWETRR